MTGKVLDIALCFSRFPHQILQKTHILCSKQSRDFLHAQEWLARCISGRFSIQKQRYILTCNNTIHCNNKRFSKLMLSYTHWRADKEA